MRALSQALPPLHQLVKSRTHVVEVELKRRWPWIVGQPWARLVKPERLQAHPRGRTLYVTIATPAQVLLHYEAPEILQRIHGYFGYAAVERLAWLRPQPLRQTTR